MRDAAAAALGTAGLAACLLWACPTHGQPPTGADGGTSQPAQETSAIEPGWLPGLVALVPGVLVHGAGHWVGGDPQTARKLLAIEGGGLAAMVLGGGLLSATGSSRKVTGPSLSMILLGTGLFVHSWLADVWGASTGGQGLGSAPARWPDLELMAGYRFIHDPQFEYRHFVGGGAHIRPGRFRLSPQLWAAVDDRNQRARLGAGYRILQQTSRQAGSFLEGRVAVDYHNFNTDGFAIFSGEIALHGRYDLADLSPSTRGAFAELSLGWAVQAFDYDAPGRGFATDVRGMLLSRMAFGLYLGRGELGRGELSVYYDHRRDGWLGGIGTNRRYAGLGGRVGLRGHYYVSDHWGVSAASGFGSAILVGTGVRYRWGGRG